MWTCKSIFPRNNYSETKATKLVENLEEISFVIGNGYAKNMDPWTLSQQPLVNKGITKLYIFGNNIYTHTLSLS